MVMPQRWKNMPPILANKSPETPSVFLPTALLREARRQKQLNTADVPAVCILDPDGDIVRHLVATGTALSDRCDGQVRGARRVCIGRSRDDRAADDGQPDGAMTGRP